MKLPSAALCIIIFCLFFFVTVSVQASGSREKSERDVSGFNNVSFETAGKLILVQGNKEYMTIDAPPGIVRRVTSFVKRKTLHIGYRGIFTRRTAEPVITLYVKDIYFLETSSSGAIEAESLNAEKLVIKTTSSGSIRIGTLHAGDIEILIDSSGDLFIADGISSTMDVNMRSSGNFCISGETGHLNLKVSSSGSFFGESFKACSSSVKLGSSGDAVLWVVDHLEAGLSGKGKLYYYGEPEINILQESARNEIISMGSR